MDYCAMHNNDLLPYLQDLVIFNQVVDCGSFTQAAQQLGLNPSAVSRSISKLEKKLKVQLLTRTTRKLNITDQGKLVYQHSQIMIQAAQQAIEGSQNLSAELSGKLHIYSPRALGKILLHPLILKFIQQHPQLEVVFQLDDRPIDFMDAQVDLEFRITEHPPVELMGRELLYIEQILCASDDYLKSHGYPMQPEDLRSQQCISLSPHITDTRWRFKNKSKTMVVDIHPHYAVNHAEARLDAIVQGIGIGTVPKFMAQTKLDQGIVHQVLKDWDLQTNYTGTVWMLYAPTKHLPNKIKVFRDFMLDHLRNFAQ